MSNDANNNYGLAVKRDFDDATAALEDYERCYLQECSRLPSEHLALHREHLEKLNLQLEIWRSGAAAEITGVPIETLRSPDNLLKLVRFFGAYKSHSEVQLQTRPEQQHDLLSMRDSDSMGAAPAEIFDAYTVFEFGEPDGERHLISTVPTRNQTAIRTFQSSGNRVLYTVVGIVVPVPTIIPGQYEIRVLLLEIQQREQPLDLLDATVNEIEEARAWTLENQHRMLPEIVKILCEQLNVLVDDDPIQQEVLEAVALQAASHGRINDESARIHSAQFGPSGVGKSKGARAVEALQPVCKTIEAACSSQDGIFGNAGLSNGRRVVRVGVVPQAHQGAVKFEDIHQTNNAKNERIIAAFNNVMERGRCDVANASRTSYVAEVAVHVDGNRRSDVEGRRQKKANGLDAIIEDLRVPKNVLSRFDYLVERQPDVRRMLRMVQKIASRPVSVGDSESIASNTVLRRVRVALALLRQEIPVVHIPADVAQYMQKRFDEVTNVDAKILSSCDDYSDFLLRGVKSYHKFIAAHARLHRRRTATTEDVDATFPYVYRKFETILRWVLGDANGGANQSARMAGRRRLIQLQFGGSDVTVSQLHRWLQTVEERTLLRDLQEIGESLGSGLWRIRKIEPTVVTPLS